MLHWWSGFCYLDLYDMTMLRFEPDKRVGFKKNMRDDGCHSYFLCSETVRKLFVGAGFIEVLIFSRIVLT
ncbi:hypothetical protein HHK36_012791 [Tetracentron sinense]|uniref:Uncharacterized protein n=1 Tax=Tetracentron sinense TaxID=13715 RepID=A0A834Z5F0_TETSI|nr:hypothetical protein HHK36_012791 [Tetracentron sinense]